MSDMVQIFLIFCITLIVIVAILKDYNILRKSTNKNNSEVIDEVSITKNKKE